MNAIIMRFMVFLAILVGVCVSNAQESIVAQPNPPGFKWGFFQYDGATYTYTPTTTNSYNGTFWNLDMAIGVSATTFVMSYTINNNDMMFTRSDTYGLGSANALYSQSPLIVGDGTSISFETWINSGSGSQYSLIDGITLNGIACSGSALATVANPVSGIITIELSSVLAPGDKLTSVIYNFTSGANTPSEVVDAGHLVTIQTVPEPSTWALLIGGLCSLRLLRKRA